LFRDVYIPAGYRITHALRCEAAALVVPDAAVLTGRSAAAILGLDLTRPGDPVEWLIEESRVSPVEWCNCNRVVALRYW